MPVIEAMPTDQEQLVNVFYEHWQAQNAKQETTFTMAEVAAVMPEKILIAVALTKMSGQIFNGGYSQYVENGYAGPAELIAELYEAAANAGVEKASELAAVVRDAEAIRRNINQEARREYIDYDDEPESEENLAYDDVDDRFYALPWQGINQAILDRLDELRPSPWVKAISL